MARVSCYLLWLVLAAMAACQSRVDLPPPAELAARSGAVHDQVMANEGLFAQGDAAGHLPKLDLVLNAVYARFGGKSIELSQATTDTGLLLIRQGRYDLAEPYFERALQQSRDVFGTDHRETGYALHDLAVVRHEIEPRSFATRIRPVIQEAIEVRRRVLGPEHQETAGSERTLGAFLLADWRRHSRRNFRSRLLVDADRYVSHALAVLERALGDSHFEVIELRYLQVEIALAMRDFRRAGSLAQSLVVEHRQPCNNLDLPPSARQLQVSALLAEGRYADAAAIHAAGPLRECNLLRLQRAGSK